MAEKKSKKNAAKAAPVNNGNGNGEREKKFSQTIKLKKGFENPAREGTKAYKFRALYTKFNGKTVREYVDGGGDPNVVWKDAALGRISLS